MTEQNDIKNDENYVTYLNHGFVGLVDVMGSDSSIVQAARVSYGKGTKTPSKDRHLIRFLMRNKHTSPFEMGEIKLHIKLPIFVMRQHVRHRTANINEYSARYSIIDEHHYVPDSDKIQKQNNFNKQGRGENFTKDEAENIKHTIHDVNESSYITYNDLINKGLAKEIARGVLPTNYYTECYWKIDLHNFLHFAGLRMDEHAQYEIRELSRIMYDLIKPYFPYACEAFEDYIYNSKTLSRMELNLLRDMVSIALGDDDVNSFIESFVEGLVDNPEISIRENYNLSSREVKEFKEKLKK